MNQHTPCYLRSYLFYDCKVPTCCQAPHNSLELKEFYAIYLDCQLKASIILNALISPFQMHVYQASFQFDLILMGPDHSPCILEHHISSVVFLFILIYVVALSFFFLKWGRMLLDHQNFHSMSTKV